MQSLFDGHPETLVFPIEIKYFWFTDFPTLFPRPNGQTCSIPSEMAKRILESRHFDFFRTRVEGYADYLDYQRFKEYLLAGELQTHADLFIRLFEALLYSLGRDPGELENLQLVEKTPFQEEYAVVLKKWFPGAKFIHVVRNPYATLCSLRRQRNWYSSGFPYLRRHLQQIRNSFFFLALNQRIISDYHLVKYEDLVTHTERVIRELWASVGLQFDAALLSPSRLGVPYSGHSSFGEGGLNSTPGEVRQAPLSHWKDTITDLEIRLVNDYCQDILRALSYPALKPRKRLTVYLPQKGEELKTYIANRFLLKDHY